MSLATLAMANVSLTFCMTLLAGFVSYQAAHVIGDLMARGMADNPMMAQGVSNMFALQYLPTFLIFGCAVGILMAQVVFVVWVKRRHAVEKAQP